MSELYDIHGAEPDDFIKVGKDYNTVQFWIQQGPVKEHGVNGCQIDSMVEFVRDTIVYFNERFPCRENSLVITKLDEALHWLEHRTKNRTKRGVEGKDEA